MTIGELLTLLRNGISAGTFSEEDGVFIRDANVSDAAMSAGSNGYVDADEVLAIGENDQDMSPGVYFMLEVFD